MEDSLEKMMLVDMFPEQVDDIKQLRNQSTLFDDICRDYETLQNELNIILTDGQPCSDDLADQIVESINGLTEEILQHLRRAPLRQPVAKTEAK